MAAFKFRLEAVLRLRQRSKDEREWELHALTQARHALEAEIAALEQELRTMDDTLGVAIGEISQSSTYSLPANIPSASTNILRPKPRR